MKTTWFAQSHEALCGIRFIVAGLMAGASVVALSQTACAQEGESVETVVVTGSRVISSTTNSPTPLTMVSTEQLEKTTPGNIPDALNKLPVFFASYTPQAGNGANGAANIMGNVLNLRSFGGQRTLVLLDGRRVTPSNADGTFDIDSLPQMLVSRVEVVTGGASAVYGSDAVTGVVNFVLDKNFTGFKVSANAGISEYGDGARQQLGVAWGSDLFDGRGHIEASARHFHQDIVLAKNRPYGSLWVSQTGAGTAANPFTFTTNARWNTRSFGGLIACSGSCPANGKQFTADMSGNVSITDFNRGGATATSSISVGGDGTTNQNGSAIGGMRADDGFARFSYNIDDATTLYVQAGAAETRNVGRFVDNSIVYSATTPGTFFVNNPYLTSAERAMFGTATTFTLGKQIIAPEDGDSMRVGGTNRNLNVTTGIDGSLFGKFVWNVFYTHGENRMKLATYNNLNNQKLYAAEDAVVDSSGKTVCYASTTPNSSAYADCVPLNPFGVTLTPEAYKYITGETWFTITNTLDNVGGAISGEIFELPAGPVKAALSGEARWMEYDVTSSGNPAQTVDCTHLRNCSPAAHIWVGNIIAAVKASENVWEIAGEADVPVLKDLPLAQAVNLNLAGRYTDYSTSGASKTWKIGLDWHLNDDIRFRGTNSVDIRAPTLNDLYLPVSTATFGYTDLLTGTGATTQQVTQGNSNLVPEVARTYSGGIVLTPSFIQGFSASLDYYRIVLKNAIGQVSGMDSQIQNLCIASGGASPYCSLYVRPYPMTNTTPANYPTAVLVESLNTSFQRMEGWDFEVNYTFDLKDRFGTIPGLVTLRGLINYQPVNETQQFPGATVTTTTGVAGQLSSKTHATFFAEYVLDDWAFTLQDHWFSGFNPSSQPGVIIYSNPSRITSFNTIDMNINKTFEIGGGTFDAYFNVQNLANAVPPVYTNTTVAIAEWYPTQKDEDRMGRYYTIGIRAKF